MMKTARPIIIIIIVVVVTIIDVTTNIILIIITRVIFGINSMDILVLIRSFSSQVLNPKPLNPKPFRV